MIVTDGASRPKPGERACGDAWCAVERAGVHLVAVVDGLGHGPEAALAAGLAVEHLRRRLLEEPEPPPVDGLLLDLHRVLRATRGAVAGLALVDPAAGCVSYAGVGNTEVLLLGATSSRLFSRSGMLGGARRPRPATQRAAFAPGARLVLYTDGVLPPDEKDELRRLPATRLARFVITRWARPADDAAVAIACWESG